MLNRRRTLPALLLFLAGLATLPSSCGEPTAPVEATPRAEALLGLPIGGGIDVGRTIDTTVTALRRLVPLASDISASATIGSEGGSISIPEAGFTLTVPREALDAPTLITVTAVQGSVVAYEFAPHGVTFRKKLVVTQDLSRTLGVGLLGIAYKGAYFESRDEIGADGSALVHELLPTTFDLLAQRLRFGIGHFSGYLVAVD